MEIKPSIIVIEEEYGRFERALIIAAKSGGIPTLAIQHGIIEPSEPAYIHDRIENVDRTSSVLSECPNPTITAVYGQYEKEVLKNHSNYSDDEVVVTGSHRYDSYHMLNEFYSKEKFCEKFRIDRKTKLVLWATQSHALTMGENEKNCNTVLSAISQLKDVVLIIKQHPGETKKYRDLINKINDQYRLSLILLPAYYDMNELLYVCDLLITKHSTTGLEAIALNKPVIVLNLGEFPDMGDYVKNGVAVGISNRNELKNTIERLLFDDSDLKKNRNIYLKNHLYAIDGKATERIVNLIEKMVNEYQSNIHVADTK